MSGEHAEIALDAGDVNLIDFAAENEAPIVTPCLLCRDNVRSAVRSAKKKVHVYFWPEFFQAAAPAATTADGEADD